MSLPVDIPVGDRWLLFLGGFLHSLQKFVTGPSQDDLILLLLLLSFLLLLLYFKFFLPLFNLISILLGLVFPQLLLLKFQRLLLLFGEAHLFLPFFFQLLQVLLVSLL